MTTFDRDHALTELLPAATLAGLGPALSCLLGGEAAVLDAAERPLWGRLPANAAREALVLELEPLGYVGAAAPAEKLRAAAILLREILVSRMRYLMASDLHADVVAADYQALLERNQALVASEARYKTLAEDLERRVAEQVRLLDERQRQLYQAEKLASVGQLAAGVAHEINNPIGFVRSNIATFGHYMEKLRALKERLHEAPAAWAELDLDFVLADGDELVRDSVAGIDRVARIVRDLKGFSNIDRPEEEVVDITDSLREVMSIVRGQLPPGVTLIEEFGVVPRILCLPGHLKQTFLNVVRNAVQAVQDAGAGTVTVASRAAAGGIEIEVRDTGGGMTEEQRTRAFEPFFTTRPVGSGTGLGLTVARDIVQAHGGTIELRSRPGAGTAVIITLPA